MNKLQRKVLPTIKAECSVTKSKKEALFLLLLLFIVHMSKPFFCNIKTKQKEKYYITKQKQTKKRTKFTSHNQKRKRRNNWID